MGKVFTTDVGTLIKLDTEEDISLGAGQKIIAHPPTEAGAPVNLLATIEDTTKLQHVKTALTLAAEGPWELQAYVELGGGIYYGEIVTLRIHAPIT